ncbi:MAG: CAP domain-containing protein, partial [Myxococcota bacterium]
MAFRVVLFCVLGWLAAAPSWGACPTAFELDVVLLVNAERANEGLAPLAIDDRLTASAQKHAQDMAQNDFFSHTGSNGSRFNERIADEGYSGGALAENIAAGYSSPAAVVEGWMNSTGHRANILNGGLRHIGVGHVQQSGTQYGQYWSQSFGGALELVDTCGSEAGSSDSLARCQADQLRALAKLCRADLACRAQGARNAGSDRAQEKLSACLARHREGFEKKFGRAAERAASELTVCTLSDSPAAVASQLQVDTAALAASVTAGQDEANSADGKLRSSLLRDGAKLCSAALAAESKHARKADVSKRDIRRTKARVRFDGRTERSVDKAANRGVSYTGATGGAIGDTAEG